METIDHVFARMREAGENNKHVPGCYLKYFVNILAPAMKKLQDENERLRESVWRVKKEWARDALDIIRMNAALKPVLDLDMKKFGDGVTYGDCYQAVVDAQRIYNKEAK